MEILWSLLCILRTFTRLTITTIRHVTVCLHFTGSSRQIGSEQTDCTEMNASIYFCVCLCTYTYTEHFVRHLSKTDFIKISESNSQYYFKMPPIPSIKHFEYLVLGGGSGGIASARRAAEFGVKVCICAFLLVLIHLLLRLA